MLGKDANGVPFREHSHTEFLSWWHDGALTRLLVWRGSRGFDAEEQRAILRAAARELSWAAMGPDADAWKIRLIPLDAAVPAPPGFDATSATTWESLTPYVPPRHRLRGGKPREAESLTVQIRHELTLRGVPGGEQVEVEEVSAVTWVAVHVPLRKTAGPTLGDRRGYWLRLTFPQPIVGPLRLGNSSSFGLGLFKPVT
jgi:CRISPR-associated protein Csb2